MRRVGITVFATIPTWARGLALVERLRELVASCVPGD